MTSQVEGSLPKCIYCGRTDYLAKNSKGEIHCDSCCRENNDVTGLCCEAIKGTESN